MRKHIAVVLAAITLLTCAGCNNTEGNVPSESVTPDNTVEFESSLYTVGSALDAVYSAAGYTYDYATTEEGEKVLEEYLSNCGTTLDLLIDEFDEDKDPSTSLVVAQVLGSVGIKSSEVDWSTRSDAFTMPHFMRDVAVTVSITQDRDEFVKLIKERGVTDYLMLIREVVGDKLPTPPRADTSFMRKMAKELSIQDVFTQYMSTSNYIDSDTIMFKTSQSTASAYELVRRDEHMYASFYPTVSGKNNDPVYMLDKCEGTDIPLWQIYFCIYAYDLQSTLDLSVSDGIINTTNDGIEIWWSPETGETVELDVYESGLIRIVYGTDDRYLNYLEDVNEEIEAGVTIKDTLRNKLRSDYDISDNTFESLVVLAKVFNLPCAQVDRNLPAAKLSNEDLKEWYDATDIFVHYLYVISGSGQESITPYEFSKQLVAFASIGQSSTAIQELVYCMNDIQSEASKVDSMAVASANDPSIMDTYLAFTTKVLDIVGSKSYFLIEGYNSLISNVTYVSTSSDRSVEIAERLTAIEENYPKMYNSLVYTFVDICDNKDVGKLLNGQIFDIDQEWALEFITVLEATTFTDDSVYETVLNSVFTWLSYGRSQVTIENISYIDLSSVSESMGIGMSNLLTNKELQTNTATIIDQAIGYADTEGSGTGDGLVKIIFG